MRPATSAIRSNSGRDSTLIIKIRAFSAAAISSSVLPTPEKTILPGLAPALRQRLNSPTDTMSKPEPSEANNLRMLRFDSAFIA